MSRVFCNRTEAGQLLAKKLTVYAKRRDVLVLGLPRGGVPVAFEVAKALKLPLDICLVRKLGVPGHSELAMGALASGELKKEVDEVVCLMMPEPLYAIGLWYEDFSQTTDQEVSNLLVQATTQLTATVITMNRISEWKDQEHLVSVTTGSVRLEGNLTIPERAKGVVLLAHGSGSSKNSTRHRCMSQMLRQARLGTLLIDLLTLEEEEIDQKTREFRFDLGLLTERIVGATDWLLRYPDTQNLKIGYFGANTVAGAALLAATERPEVVGAIVSRGGRPELAGSALSRIRAATLLIVGEKDTAIIESNRKALAGLHTEKRLEIVPRATHLFEEPGMLEEVARLTSQWFQQHLTQTTNLSRI
ncbi:MAG: hypothetical protein WA919_18100 [Coleofasciculaceae cyanobacterium]